MSEREITPPLKALFEQLLEAADNSDADRVCSIILQQGLPSLQQAVQSGALSTVLGQQGLTRLLHYAAHYGNLELMRIVLDEPLTEVNAQQKQGCTALIIACWKGHTEAANLLLLNGADVLISTRDDFTCLHLAAFCGHTEVVNFLLYGKCLRNCCKDCKDCKDCGLLHMAAFCRDSDALDCLVNGHSLGENRISAVGRTFSKRRWALIARKTEIEKFTALHMAAKQTHNHGVEIARSISEAFITSVLDVYGCGATNPNVELYRIENEPWRNFLFQIRKELHLCDGEISETVMTQNLAAYGNHGGGLALREKLGNEYEGFVHAFVELILYSTARDKIGRTALHHAAWEEKAELVSFLTGDSKLGGPLNLQLGSIANVNIVDVDGYTPLHLASRNGCSKVVEVLMGINISDTPSSNDRQFHKLVAKETYLQTNVAANPRGRSQEIAIGIHTALDRLVDDCDDRLPRPALESSIWLENRTGVTPLHYAVEKDHVDVVKLLIQHPNTDLFLRASNGQSPWAIACRRQPTGSNQLLIQKLLGGDATSPVWGPDRGPDTCKYSGKESDSYLLSVPLQKLLKRAAELSVAAEADEDSTDNLQMLERQITVSFKAALANDQTYKGYVRQISETEASSSKDCRLNLLHVAAYYGCGPEIEVLLTLAKYKDLVNVREEFTSRGQTALHFAIDGGTGALAALLKEEKLNVTNESREGLTPVDYVQHREYDKTLPEATAQKMLTDYPMLTDHLHKQLSTYTNAVNAVTVAASVIASATLTLVNTPASSSYSLLSSQSLGTLAFYYALAVVVTGVAATLPPTRSDYIHKEVRRAQRWTLLISALFAACILYILLAFSETRYALTVLCLSPVLVYVFFGRLATWRLLGAICRYIGDRVRALIRMRMRPALLRDLLLRVVSMLVGYVVIGVIGSIFLGAGDFVFRIFH